MNEYEKINYDKLYVHKIQLYYASIVMIVQTQYPGKYYTVNLSINCVVRYIQYTDKCTILCM